MYTEKEEGNCLEQAACTAKGVCKINQTASTYYCECPAGLHGDFCQQGMSMKGNVVVLHDLRIVNLASSLHRSSSFTTTIVLENRRPKNANIVMLWHYTSRDLI